MAELIPSTEFSQLFLRNTPLLDVRAPIEFNKGAFPNSACIPLLNDAEREAVGTQYRKLGREAAIKLGEELLTQEMRAQRIQDWSTFVSNNPNSAIYCFRGGLRSTIVQQWLGEAGVQVPRIAGGFKAMRRYLIESIQEVSNGDNLMVLAGKTGTGKTHILNSLDNSLDLEGFAAHRGSAFGRRALAQPSQINFENAIAIRLLELNWEHQQRIVVEDESHAIGSLSVPHQLHQRMLQSPIAMIEESLEQRINTIHVDYIQSNYQEFKNLDAENADSLFSESLLSALERIRRRLGEESYQTIHTLMSEALVNQFNTGDVDAHKLWISKLLELYYDPMYEYQLQKKEDRIVFRGNSAELAAWIRPIISTRHRDA